MDPNLVVRLEACEQANRRLRRWLIVQFGVLAVVGLGAAANVSSNPATPNSLRASELVIVDRKGVERVRIGGDLPDAVIGGKRVPRGEQAAGLLLYDSTGQERGGYVTWEPSGNVGLTLDSRKSQVGLLVAGPEGGSAVQLWHGRDLIELRSDENGSRLTGVKDGSVQIQQPAISALTPGSCKDYREARSRVPAAQVMRDCRRRFDEAPCSACLAPDADPE
jgi:hypothetical protein